MSITGLFCILAGFILLTGLFGVIPALGKYLEKFAKWLGSFQGIIGIIAFIVGLLGILNIVLDGEGFLSSLFCIISGIMLATGILMAIPAFGKYIEKMAKWLGTFQTIIGIITLIVGLLAFF